MRPSNLTECNVMTALCLWEASLEAISADRANELHCGEGESLTTWLREEGAYEARQMIIDMAPTVDRAWDIEDGPDNANDGITFDWDFCPEFLALWHKLAKRAGLTAREASADDGLIGRVVATVCTNLQANL